MYENTLSVLLWYLFILVEIMIRVLVLGTCILPVASRKADRLPAPLAVFLKLCTELVLYESVLICGHAQRLQLFVMNADWD